MSEEIAPGIVFRRIHRELMAIHQCNEGLERLPRQLKAQQNRLASAEKAKNDASDLLKKAKVEQHQSEVSLKQLNALNTVGYKELFDVIEGKTSLEEAVNLIKQNTRRYAKRQLTWLRHWTDKRVFVAENPLIEREVLASVQQILDNAH